jgi:hypothetical protein
MPAVDNMPPDLMEAAQEADDIVGAELAALVPAFEKPVNVKVMNALAKAIADVGRVMGMDIQPDTYTEPVMEMEPDVVRFLAMIDATAEDYGKPLPVSLDALRTEADLTALTAAMMELAKDKDFEAFLDMPTGAEGDEPDVAIDVEVAGPDRGMEMEEDFDFSSRMRR